MACSAGGRRPRAAEGAVAVGGEDRGDPGAAAPRGGGRVVDEEHGEVGERLPRAAELALVDLPPGRREQRGRGDAGEALPPARLVHPVARRVADVERPDGALPELRRQPLRLRRERPAAARLGRQHPELLLAQQERLQQAPDPLDGHELLLPAAAGSPQVREVRGDVAVELLHLGLHAGRRHRRRSRRRGRGVAAEGEERAAEGGERGGVGVGRRG